jgi:aspartate 1-decarboxylase
VIEGEPGSGDLRVNGAAARLVQRGQKVIIASFGAYDESDLRAYSPIVVHLDAGNRVVRVDSNPEVLLGAFVPDWDTEEVPGAFTSAGDTGSLS